MCYIEIGGYTYNLTGIVICVFMVAFFLGVMTYLNDRFLECKKRWQQILVRFAFIEVIFMAMFFAWPKCSLDLSAAKLFEGWFLCTIVLVILAVVIFLIGMYFAGLMKWIFAKSES